MHVPLPRNRLVQLTLVGALLTTLVAAALVVPGGLGDQSPAPRDATDNLSADAPTPNGNFTPAVSGGGGSGEYEDEEYEPDEHEREEEEEDDDEEYEQHHEVTDAVGERP
ncbi:MULTISPECIES: hypothetical protein [Salinibaculum]|uniref:hypothetical protein n=1 Tax=Salinibaculum TaxID=2732368 RepID=UPI0030CB4A36